MKLHSLVTLFLLSLLFNPLFAAPKPPKAAIASAHPQATAAGLEILKQGGNAFDAAITVAAVLAVVEPYSSGIGGGGFWLLHRASDGKQTMLDGRETAPSAAHRDMYLDAKGDHDRNLSLNGPLAAGIPGVPKALDHLANNYGKLPLSVSLAPAIRLAREGFKVDAYMRYMIKVRQKALLNSPAAAEVFLNNGEIPALDEIIVQRDLANTLEAIATRGAKGFYQGSVADKLINGTQAAGGIWKAEDLANYQVVERQPITGTFHGARIISAAPPSSGGIALVETLNILEKLPYGQAGKIKDAHLIIESMRRAYRDRAAHLGDPDFVKVPVAKLTSKIHAEKWRKDVDIEMATPSEMLPPAVVEGGKGSDTTHYSIIDQQGNRVAATLSINIPFGSGFMPAGTGVILNDEMDDFSAKPGAPNVYGLIGNEANAIAPGKRPLSSMTPTFLENDRGVVILGTPGGSRIISMVLLASLSYLQGADAETMVSRPRFHHQYLPDSILLEPTAFTGKEQNRLSAMGHTLKSTSPGYSGKGHYGNMHVIIWDQNRNLIDAASDPRGIGAATALKVEIPYKSR